ncbi:LYSM-DOMAIN RECEPTOR-LIKE KINASE-RELATED [Salix viminalis]|uniref:LYSM-DOMAIN RECEPTOR-LIKE KINASE-RELATED n=1 Tax=Salix viminalis TaxID=40686 RepID=A0A9Q0NTS3_SALVM|nr:LYSM-DOMAIN RECEPTOR-LIKE KINASE-RELATED [Salix viminalis]
MQASSTTNNKQSPRTSKGENSCPVAVAINSDVEERDLMDILPKLRLYHPHFPALHVAWKGGFKFDVAALRMFYGGFQAQLPCRVHRKAYESSRNIPLILQVKLLPQFDILGKTYFKTVVLIFSDIALYFFPSANIERSKENHASLFQLMETENAAIRSYIYGIELLIFTSKQLHVDSQDVIARSGMGNFLWGVFRHAKHDKTICNKFPSLATPLRSEHDDHANMDRDEAVDMEIDMVGGTVIGRIDVAVPKESSKETGNWAQRIRIALDVANGLYYLHSFTEPAYVHQDIKSSNVMLNDNLRAKIANFSLARAATSAAMTKHVVGSIGYMAPEYVREGQVTPKIDVYAFGVVLLEMITGKDAVFTQDDREVLLSTAIVSIMENKNPEVELDFSVDPALKGSCRTDFALCLAKVSVACLIKEPARRPGMEEVVSILLKIQANVQKS